ncbi:MAG: hypothetical protein ABI855_10160 [Bacteroidota bacterium]
MKTNSFSSDKNRDVKEKIILSQLVTKTINKIAKRCVDTFSTAQARFLQRI